MRIELFGRLAAVRGGEVIDRFPTHRAKLLLAYLAYHRDRAHPRGIVAEMLWPGGNPDALRLRLNQTVLEVRNTLRPFGEVFESDRFSLRLDPTLSTDVDGFLALIKKSKPESDLASRASILKQAVEAARHDFLPGFYEDWVLAATDDLSERLKEALLELTDFAAQEGNWPEVVIYARRAAGIDPYSERIQQRLLQGLIETDQRPEAVAKYREFETLLQDNFAISPSDATKSVVRAVLTGEVPSLSRPLAPRRLAGPSNPKAESGSREDGSIEEVLETYIQANDAERAMRCAGALLIYWNLKGQLHLGRNWFRRIFAMPAAIQATPEAHCVALIPYGQTCISVKDFQTAEAALNRALEIARSMGHSQLTADALRAQGQAALRQSKMEVAGLLFEQSLAFARQSNDLGGVADSLTGLGEVLRFMGSFEEARDKHSQARELRRIMDRMDRAALSTLNLGILASRMGDYRAALSLLREALSTIRIYGSRAALADCLMETAGALVFTGDSASAARLLSAVSHLRALISAPIPISDRPDYVQFLSEARALLGRERFASEWALGQTSPLEEVIDFALEKAKS